MSNDTDSQEGGSGSGIRDWSRRAVLKLTGAGAGVTALGGAGTVGGSGQDGEEEETPDETATDDGLSLGHSIDRTFGYPLAADETVEADLPQVELYTEEGPGAHENFPLDPESEGEFQFEFAFDPVGIQVEPYEVVQFLTTSGEHTATAFHEKFTIPQREMPTRVPDGVPGFTSPPIVENESWLYQFTTSGVYDVVCLPHQFLGMVMRVVVIDPDEDDVEDDAFAAPTAGTLSPNVEAVLTADELDPANIVDAGMVAWSDLTLDVQPPETEGTETGQTETAAPTVQVREHAEYGDVLVGPDGMSLYMFDQDAQGEPQSACYDGCAESWPPLTVAGDPAAGEAVTADLETFERETGETQVVANGWPLYYFAQDEAPGDAAGQGANDVWWLLGPDGTPVRDG